MIRFENVSKIYYGKGGNRKIIVQDLNLTIPTGRSVGLIGRNGAGKSTILRMIAGSILPDAGRIVREGSVSWPLGFGGGMSGALSGVQNARFVARIYGRDTEEMERTVAEFSELGAYLHMPVGTYSSGMRARLAFAISMGVDFEVYLIDELTSVGDAAFRQKARQAFADKVGRASVIMVSHQMGTLRRICSAGALLNNGELIYYDDIGDAIAHYQDVIGADADAD